MMLGNRAKQQGAKPVAQRKVAETPKLDVLIAKRDYVGAITLLEFELQQQREAHSASGWQHNPVTGEYEWVAGGTQPPKPDASTEEVRRLLWLAYAAFHCGDFKKVSACPPAALHSPRHPMPSFGNWLACRVHWDSQMSLRAPLQTCSSGAAWLWLRQMRRGGPVLCRPLCPYARWKRERSGWHARQAWACERGWANEPAGEMPATPGLGCTCSPGLGWGDLRRCSQQRSSAAVGSGGTHARQQRSMGGAAGRHLQAQRRALRRVQPTAFARRSCRQRASCALRCAGRRLLARR